MVQTERKRAYDRNRMQRKRSEQAERIRVCERAISLVLRDADYCESDSLPYVVLSEETLDAVNEVMGR